MKITELIRSLNQVYDTYGNIECGKILNTYIHTYSDAYQEWETSTSELELEVIDNPEGDGKFLKIAEN